MPDTTMRLQVEIHFQKGNVSAEIRRFPGLSAAQQHLDARAQAHCPDAWKQLVIRDMKRVLARRKPNREWVVE